MTFIVNIMLTATNFNIMLTDTNFNIMLTGTNLNIKLNNFRQLTITKLLNMFGRIFSTSFYRYILIPVKIDASVGATKEIPVNTKESVTTQLQLKCESCLITLRMTQRPLYSTQLQNAHFPSPALKHPLCKSNTTYKIQRHCQLFCCLDCDVRHTELLLAF